MHAAENEMNTNLLIVNIKFKCMNELTAELLYIPHFFFQLFIKEQIVFIWKN